MMLIKRVGLRRDDSQPNISLVYYPCLERKIGPRAFSAWDTFLTIDASTRAPLNNDKKRVILLRGFRAPSQPLRHTSVLPRSHADVDK